MSLFAAIAAFSVLTARTPVSGTIMRLRPKPGQVFDFSLRVERFAPNESGELIERVKIASVDKGVVTMHIQLVGLKFDGKDRTKDLLAVVGRQTVVMPWTDLSRRTGQMSGLSLHPGDSKVMRVLSEAGIYACDFLSRGVSPGDRWPGSTTATGGCTGATYTLKDIVTKNGRTIANFELTDIAMSSSRQIGPMKMTVDLAHGLPTLVEYTVADTATGRKSKFVQTLVSVSGP